MASRANEAVVIPLSKFKLTLVLLASIAFVMLSGWVWRIAETQTRFNPLTARGAALAGAAFFSWCGCYGAWKLFDRKPGLIIDRDGIVDNSSAVACGRIPWADITGVAMSSIAGQWFLTINVTNPQEVVARSSRLVQLLNAANTSLTGSPINISSNSLRVSLDDLQRLLIEAMERHKNR